MRVSVFWAFFMGARWSECESVKRMFDDLCGCMMVQELDKNGGYVSGCEKNRVQVTMVMLVLVRVSKYFCLCISVSA